MDRPSIYDAVGGDAAFLAVARAFHARALDDSELNHPFSHPGHACERVAVLRWSWTGGVTD